VTGPIIVENENFWGHRLFETPEQNFIMNGTVSNGKLYLSARFGIAILNDINSLPKNVELYSPDFGFNTKPVFSNDGSMIAYFDIGRNNRIHINWTEYGTGYGTSFSLSSLNEKFKDYSFQRSSRFSDSEFGAFIDNRFVALIGNQSVSPFWNNDAYVIWADLMSVSHPDGYRLRVIDKGYWRIPNRPNEFANLTAIFNYNNNVFIAVQKQRPLDGDGGSHYIIVVSEYGSFNHFSISGLFRWNHPVVNFFEYQGYLIAELITGEWYATHDGKKWNRFATHNVNVNNHTEIDDFIIFNFVNQIVLVGNSIYDATIYEIPISNLMGHTITSFNKFNDYLVVTSSHGIFYKLWSDVISAKYIQNTN